MDRLDVASQHWLRRAERDDLRPLVLGIVVTPIFWVLGVEQFAWPLILGVALLTLKKVVIPNEAVVPTALLCLLFLSVASIDQDLRIVSWARYFASWGVLVALVVYAGSVTAPLTALIRLGRAMVLLTSTSALLCWASIGGMMPDKFQAVLSGHILPGSIQATQLGELVVTRRLVREDWFVYLGNYYRFEGIFLYPNDFAMAIIISLPMATYLALREKSWSAKVFYFALAAILAASLAMTTSRLAVLGLVLGVFVLWIANLRSSTRLLLTLGLTVVGLAAYGLWDAIMPLIDSMFYMLAEGRGSSVSSRAETYWETLKAITARPWLGYGAERRLADLPLPLGSHSYYLALLFRYGVVVGGLAVAWILYILASTLAAAVRARGIDMALRGGIIVVNVALAVMWIGEAPDLDLTVFVMSWLMLLLSRRVVRGPRIANRRM